MKSIPLGTRRPLNAIWLSDIHLGYRGCRAEFILDFLQNNPAKIVYLVGDVFDFWALKRQFMWPASHHAVLKKILAMAADGTRVVYIPGNHDDPCRDLCGKRVLNIEIMKQAVHKTADGKRLLIVHGDEFDHAVRCNRLHKLAGDMGYSTLLVLNRWSNRVRKWLGLPYWSLAYYVKNRVRNARKAIHSFEEAAAAEARARGLDGIVCGHIHQPEIRTINGVLYCNDGDWVESCTALVEHNNGRLELMHWGDLQQSIKCDQAANDDHSRPLRLPALVS
jgi:UDP-2,3-diacylglucosamine pyrophosphatase LpxH